MNIPVKRVFITHSTRRIIYLGSFINTITLRNTTVLAITSKKRIPELDGIRGLAILLVLIFHFVSRIQTVPGTPIAYALVPFRLFWSGVDLFFVLSGFLIAGILIENKQSQNYFSIFYVRRAFRIFPLYYLVLSLYVIIDCFPALSVHNTKLFESDLPIWGYVFYIQNWLMAFQSTGGPHWLVVTWSLAIEEQFYLTLPTIIRLVPPFYLVWIIVAIAVCAFGLRVVLSPQYDFAIYVLTVTRADSLMAGVLCAIALRNQRIIDLIQRYEGFLKIALAALLTLLGVLSVSNRTMPNVNTTPILYSLLAIFYSLLLILTLVGVEYKGMFARVFLLKPLRYLGMRAYAIYLFHPIAIYLCFYFLNREPVVESFSGLGILVFAVAASLLLAEVSWHFFEKPLLSVGQRWNYFTVLKMPGSEP